MINIECNFCNNNMSFYYSGSYSRGGQINYPFEIYKCSSCKIYKTNPEPNNEVYETTRSEDDTFHGEETVYNQNIIKNILNFRTCGKLLEVGCNSGDLLELAKNSGFEVLGMEIDEVASDEAKRLKRNVLREDFVKYNFSEKYDVIVFNHVFEHIHDLISAKNKIKEILAENGVVFINVPNIEGFIAKIMKQKWCPLAPNTHVWFFTKSFFRNFFSNDFDIKGLTSNTYSEPIVFSSFNFKMFLKSIIVKLSAFIGRGDEIQLVLKHKTIK